MKAGTTWSIEDGNRRIERRTVACKQKLPGDEPLTGWVVQEGL